MSQPLFPLPLASIETLHLCDDSAEYPNNIFARLTFDSELDESLAREAFQRALTRHVRGYSSVEKRRGRWYWTADCGQSPEFIWRPPALSDQFRPLRLQAAPGVRMVAHENGSGWQVSWQVHHALVDGLGGLQFVRDWMVLYDNLREGRSADQGLSPLDPYALRRLNRLDLLSRRYLSNLWRQPIAMFGAAKFLLRRFQTITPPAPARGQPVANLYPSVVTQRYDREIITGLRRAAVRLRATLNSLLLAATFIATETWMRRWALPLSEDCLRVIVPISIRTPADQHLPACNRASLVQLDRVPATLRDRAGLTQGIDFEIGLIRRWQLDRMFLIAVRAHALSTRWLESRAARQTRRATTMLTNLGRPFLKTGIREEQRHLMMGGHRLTDVELIAPIREGMPISLAAVEYAGSLFIALHYDARVLTAEQAADFAHTLDEQVRLFVD